MKVSSISAQPVSFGNKIIIRDCNNKECQYLWNKVTDIVRKDPVPALFDSKGVITLNRVTDKIRQSLEKFKIVFEEIIEK
jgi:hypothetical protein